MWHDVPDSQVSNGTVGGVGAMLRCAAETGNMAMAKMLLDLGVPIFSADEKWNTPLIIAVKAAGEIVGVEDRDDDKLAQSIEMLRFLDAHGADRDVFNKHRENAYDLALLAHNSKILRAVSPADVDTDRVMEHEMNELLKAAEENRGGDIHNLLQGKTDVEKLAAINQPTEQHGLTPLMVAARDGRTQAVEALLELKANPTIISRSGQITALMLAIGNLHADVVKQLVSTSCGAELLEQSDRGAETPIFHAARSGSR
eukprot:6428063-Prymnesium_polylepis.1